MLVDTGNVVFSTINFCSGGVLASRKHACIGWSNAMANRISALYTGRELFLKWPTQSLVLDCSGCYGRIDAWAIDWCSSLMHVRAQARSLTLITLARDRKSVFENDMPTDPTSCVGSTEE